MNFDAEAKRIANFVVARRQREHRGVVPLRDAGTAALFGNDNYVQDERTREQVRLLFEAACEAGIQILGFATDDVEHTAWALVVRSDDLDWLKARLHDAFFQSYHIYSGQWSVDSEPLSVISR